MWTNQGYTGPIAHWWESNFLYTGPLYDWRYEGIIDGYRLLFRKTGCLSYLYKAIRAADVVIAAQLSDGRYRNSSFQFGPVAGGTPHEAAIDAALFRLAEDLRTIDHKRAARYERAGLMNIREYWVRTLWTGSGFADQPTNPVLVANKHGTLLEALCAGGLVDGCWSQYIDTCVQVIFVCQVPHGPQAGGTIHRGIGPSRLAIPIYTARAMNGLVSLYERDPRPELKEAVLRSLPFFARTVGDHGVIWGIYGDGRRARSPEMIAGSGDVLRLLWRVRDWDSSANALLEGHLDKILRQQQPGGGFPTAAGFAVKGRDLSPHCDDVRDVVPVVGWVDKMFRALVLLSDAGPTRHKPIAPQPYRRVVGWRGHPVTWEETPTDIRILRKNQVVYHWPKGQWAPTIYAL